jgi:AmmeMemoRadiSam system protein B
MLIWPGAAAAAACPAGDAPFPSLYGDATLFMKAIAAAEIAVPARERPTGIVVPHHLLAPELIALGMRAASAHRYRQIVVLAPDHFRASTAPLAISTRGFATVLGEIAPAGALAAALRSDGLAQPSCLFAADHGVQALLPFIRHYFPGTPVTAIAISVKSTKRDWERLAKLLSDELGEETLVVQSTDFSHYLPHAEAARHDQQTLNLLAAGDVEGLAMLRQPAHADSVGALYAHARYQLQRHGARPLVIANENSQERSRTPAAETTSYMVILYGSGQWRDEASSLSTDEIIYFGGDLHLGRGMTRALAAEEAQDAVVDAVLGLTRGRPLIVNLEGVVLPDVPAALPHMTLVMPEDLTVRMLQKLGVAAVGLANNHALDLGAAGHAETLAALGRAGIPAFSSGETHAAGSVDVVGLSDFAVNDAPPIGLIDDGLLDRLVRGGSRPVVAYVHWGREYVPLPAERELDLIERMRLRAPSIVVGAHPHVADGKLAALAGGDMLLAYSLGNFLFDQTAARASGTLLEMRIFSQGTFFARLIPLPNLYDLARGVQQEAPNPPR